jgi:hypothetical protein
MFIEEASKFMFLAFWLTALGAWVYAMRGFIRFHKARRNGGDPWPELKKACLGLIVMFLTIASLIVIFRVAMWLEII